MKALQFYKSIPRYALLKLLGSQVRRRATCGLMPVAYRDVAEPKLPSARWVRIAPRLAGICGSDLATLCAKGSPYLAPLTSMPFVMGHEVVGDIVEAGREVARVRVGDRVVLHPALGCEARGLDPRCAACADRQDALCRNVTRGDVSAGIQTGYCRDTGGGFGESLVAHESQVYRVPESVSDRAAVLIEPFACAIHAALRVSLGAQDTALIIGSGAVGLLTLAALRASGCKARIVAVAKYDHQRRLAHCLGADECLDSPPVTWERYQVWAPRLDAETFRPELGKPPVIGGATATFDCVASSQTIDDGLRFTRSGGTFVLVGMPGIPRGVDWTPLWFKELTLHAAYAYGTERTANGRVDTFDLAVRWMEDWSTRLEPLVSEPYELKDYRAAFAAALRTGKSGRSKTIFAGPQWSRTIGGAVQQVTDDGRERPVAGS